MFCFIRFYLFFIWYIYTNRKSRGGSSVKEKEKMSTICEILASTTRPDGKPVAVLRDASIDIDAELSDTDTQLLREMLNVIKSAIAATWDDDEDDEGDEGDEDADEASDPFSEKNGWSSDWDPCDFSVYRKVGDPDRCYIESVEGFGGPNFEAVYSTEWPTEHAEVRGRWGGTSIKIEEYGEELYARLFERAESEYPAEY